MLKGIRSSQYLWGFFITFWGGIAWAFSGACSQFLNLYYGITPEWLSTVRMLGAGATMAAMYFWRDRGEFLDMASSARNWFWLVVYGIAGVWLGNYAFLKSILYTDVGIATVLVYTSPVFILVITCLHDARLPRRVELFSVTAAFAGCVCLATHLKFEGLALPLPGLAWGIASALGVAANTLLPIYFLGRYKVTTFLTVGTLIAGVFIFFAADFPSIPFELDFIGWCAVLVTVWFGTVIAFILFMQGVKLIGGVKASIVSCVEPVSAAIFAVVLFGVQYAFMDFMGLLLILAAIIALALSKR